MLSCKYNNKKINTGRIPEKINVKINSPIYCGEIKTTIHPASAMIFSMTDKAVILQL
jgi:hypothetical protein